MLKRLFTTLAIFLLIHCNLHSINTITPQKLEEFSSVAAYSVIQDSRGALWLSTSKGLYRYNGHSLYFIRSQIPRQEITSGGEYVFAQTQEGIRKYNISTLESKRITFNDDEIQADAIASDGPLFFAASRNKILACMDESLCPLAEIPGEVKITHLSVLPDHRLVVSTANSGVYTVDTSSKTVRHVLDEICVTAIDICENGCLWVSLQNGGMRQYDTSSWAVIRDISFQEEHLSQSIRAIAQDEEGNVFAGTAQGLYRIDANDGIHLETIGNLMYCPICCLLHDDDGNLWIGTYYGGMLLACPRAYPYEELQRDSPILTIRGIAEGKDGCVYIFTDGNGIWKYDISSNKTSIIPGSTGIKYQNAFLDSETGLIWSGEFQGGVYSLSPTTGKINFYDFSTKEPQTNRSICRHGKDLILGCENGLYAFNPDIEKKICRKITGLDSYVYDIETGPDGRIWIAGAGLYTMDSDSTAIKYKFDDRRFAWIENSSCYDIAFDMKGSLWMAFARRGVAMMNGSTVRHFTKENCGILDNYTFSILPIKDSLVLIETASGMTVVNSSLEAACVNYSSIDGQKAAKLSDGSILVGGNNGLKKLTSFQPFDSTSARTINIDFLFANGTRSTSHTLDHTQRNFEFDITTFDYTGTVASSYYCRLDGFDKEWKRFDIEKPVVYMNMKPKKYCFKVEMRSFAGEVLSSDSLDIRIKPAWYATTLSKILIILLIFGSAGAVILSRNSRRKLAEELTKREREDKERTAFFIDLSYQLRTPLNLIIGNLERFFHDFGSRTAGIETIEDIYTKTKQMRSLISEYVDTQSDSVEQESNNPWTHGAVKDAKFVNSAIGAVERNLYSPDLNVPLLCKEMNLGKTALSDKMRAATGMSPREFIEDIKLKTAAQMLLDGNLRIAEISDLLNFSTPKYFSQRFMLKFGVKPKDYAKH